MSKEVPIPTFYVDLARNSTSPQILFKKYVVGYVRNNYHGYKLVRIKGMKAIIEAVDIP